MATLLVKSLAIGGGVAGLTTAGIGTYYLTSNNSQKEESTQKTNTEKAISEWLAEDGKKILDNNAASDWKANWTKFKEGQKKETARVEPWNLTDWNTVFDQVEAPDSFKAKCNSNKDLKIGSKSDQKYTELVTFCTKQPLSVQLPS